MTVLHYIAQSSLRLPESSIRVTKTTGGTIRFFTFKPHQSASILALSPPCPFQLQSRSISYRNKFNYSISINGRFRIKLDYCCAAKYPVVKNFLLSRRLQTSRSLEMSDNSVDKISEAELYLRKKYEPREITFKTPYGHIACLEWGETDAPYKILCVHGWLDNAGSFERLIPFILDRDDNCSKYHVVSMDMPGVGHSSHRPPGSDYTTFSHVMEMRRVAQQLGWRKLILLSHSLGSHFSFIYSCVYPDQVETLISIDLAHPLTRQIHNWNITIANSIEDHFKCEYSYEDDPTTNIRVPVYSEVDVMKRLMDGHSSSLTRPSAEVLLKRGAKKQRWGYTFNRDIRLRHLSLEMRPDDDLMLQYLQGPFGPNLFVIRAARSPYHRPEKIRLKYYELFEKNCPTFRDTILDGTHHLHLNTPELVASEINKFLDDVCTDKTNGGLQTGSGDPIGRSNL